MTEGGRLKIKSHRRIVGSYALQMLQYYIYHTVNRMGIEPIFVGQGTDTVICAVEYAVAVNYKKSFHQVTLILKLFSVA